MNDLVAIALSVPATAFAVATWDIGRRWVAERSAAALHLRQDEHEQRTAAAVEKVDGRCAVVARAVENLAKETAGENENLRAQLVGVVSATQGSRPRSFSR